MIDPKALLFSFKSTAQAMEKFVSDVDDADMARQPVEGINHPVWLLGHVGIYHDVIVALLNGESFDSPWDAPCGKNSTPSADRSAYPSKEEALRLHREGVERAAAAIESASPEAWSAEMTHPTWGKQFDSVGAAVVYLAAAHISLHTGQLSGWRRAMGLPRV